MAYMGRKEECQTIADRAIELLRESYGPGAEFRPGQLEAIVGVVEGRNSLVVQKTGWGKSLVYFVATKILRECGAGPTLIISPLLALMGNQIDSARSLGIEAVTINSDNKDSWQDIYAGFGVIDALIVSPERLANDGFMEHLAEVRNIRLVVVDEAHSISDWGHDFRPDYQRVSKLIEALPDNVTVLGTTATANDRVIGDVKRQLGDDLAIVRGDLIRENLAIQVNPLQTREQRLAWLARVLIDNEILSSGQGIIYCLTHSDCIAVYEFLSERGVSVLPYYSGMGEDEANNSIEKSNLESFVENRTRILAATVKLGMGYDKSDIKFVIHFQLPQNLIAYYQQIGRAGRDGEPAYAILLHGREDEEILSYFIETAQAAPDLLERIVAMAQAGATQGEMLGEINVGFSKLKEALKYLLVHDYLYKDGITYRANAAKPFDIEKECRRQQELTSARISEHEELLRFLESEDCFMQHVAKELDAPDGTDKCGICANCTGHYLIPVADDQHTLADATEYLGSRHGSILPRKRWGVGGAIKKDLLMQPGWCLCADYYSAAGSRVRKGKYVDGAFSDELVDVSARYLMDKVGEAGIECVVPVPSLRRPNLVLDFARSLATRLGTDFADALEKTNQGCEQKAMLNSAMQEMNIRETVAVADARAVRGKAVLLVDDMVDSRWTFTVIAAMLLEVGAAAVYPFALAKTGGGN